MRARREWWLAFCLAAAGCSKSPRPRFQEVDVRTHNCFSKEVSFPIAFKVIPHCRETVSGYHGEVEASFNKLGLRDRDYGPKPKGMKRLLVLGDSNLVAIGLPENLTWPRMLERRLRSNGERWEVINGGTDGFSSLETALMLPGYLDEYKPDLVIYVPNSSKTYALDGVHYSYLERDEAGRPLKYYRDTVGRRVPSFLRSYLRATEFRQQATITAFEIWDHFRMAVRARLFGGHPFVEATATLTRDMATRCQERGVPFLLALETVPVRNNVNSARSLLTPPLRFAKNYLIPPVAIEQSYLQSYFQKAGIQWIPVEIDRKILAYYATSGIHLNEEGNWAYSGAVERGLHGFLGK